MKAHSNSFRKLIHYFLVVIMALLPQITWASETPEMADVLRQNGKIYIVILVIVTIFTGIILFLIYLERKISRLEKNNPLN
jgi:heme/copper-type cytochrome/quinol oxidase subunit 2